MDASPAPAVRVRGLVTRFGSQVIHDGLDLDIRRGEVLALLGENGAGKSTLVKCISGVYALDEGEVLLDGDIVSIHSPAAGWRARSRSAAAVVGAMSRALRRTETLPRNPAGGSRS